MEEKIETNMSKSGEAESIIVNKNSDTKNNNQIVENNDKDQENLNNTQEKVPNNTTIMPEFHNKSGNYHPNKPENQDCNYGEIANLSQINNNNLISKMIHNDTNTSSTLKDLNIHIKKNSIGEFYEYEQVNFSMMDKKMDIKVVEFNETSDPDFMSSSYYVYKIVCENYKSTVFRRYNDFVWFRENLVKYYPGIHIPPIPPKSVTGKMLDKDFHNKRMRGFNKFFEHLVTQKILASSVITKDFLTEGVAIEFNRKKKNYSLFQPDNAAFIEKVTYSLDFNEEIVSNNNLSIQKLKTSIKSITLTLNELTSEFGKLQEDFKRVSERLSNISKLMNHVYQHHKVAPEFYTDIETKYFNKFSEFTKSWSSLYLKQVEFSRINFQEFFGQCYSEYESFDKLVDSYSSSKNKYLSKKEHLEKKKEKYFSQQNVDKWDLANQDILNMENFMNNKEECLKRMLKTETKEIEILEFQYYFMNYQVLNEYIKLRKYINGLIEKQNKQLENENKEILIDVFQIIKLVTMNI